MTLKTTYSVKRLQTAGAGHAARAATKTTASAASAAPASAAAQWQALEAHRHSVEPLHMRDLFAAAPQRAQHMSVDAGPLHIDYSKHRATPTTLQLLQDFAAARDVAGWRARMRALRCC